LIAPDDDDGFIASYLWSQISGPAVTLPSPTSATTTFTAPDVTAFLKFQLTVKDNDDLQATDTCIVNVEGVPPIADAGPDQDVKEGETITLDGSNSGDPDGFIRSYLWTQIGGPSVTQSSTTAVKPTFTAPDAVPEGASLTFRLKVNDNDDLQATDTCIVNVGDILITIGDNDGYGYGRLIVQDNFDLPPCTKHPGSCREPGRPWIFDNRSDSEMSATDGSQYFLRG
jgi:hypothetical protein